MYSRGIPITVIDPETRAAYASQVLEFKAVNPTVLPEDDTSRNLFLQELAQFLKTGVPGRFVVVEENLGELFLVDISSQHRLSRKAYATHPLIPGKLLVIGGIGLVQPDERNHCLTLQTPQHDTTLHRYFPDLAASAMSAACPTPHKTIESIPNVDPLGALSPRVAELKFTNVAMIQEGRKGVDPTRFPVIDNVAWGTIGSDVAFYVYAVPAIAAPVGNMLHANSQQELVAALTCYMQAGHKLMRALRHLHEAGYVFNQAHQGNIYYYQDARGEVQILVADLDTLQSVRDFSPKIPEGEYLSPRAFATLVNVQVASTNIARNAWIYLLQGTVKKLHLSAFPGLERIYASIIIELLSGYLGIDQEQARSSLLKTLSDYFLSLDRQNPSGANEAEGIFRLLKTELYETDVFGFLFTYILLDKDYCRLFGARRLSDGIKPVDVQRRSALDSRRLASLSVQDRARLLDQVTSQIIEARSNEAMAEFMKAISRRKTRILKNTK